MNKLLIVATITSGMVIMAEAANYAGFRETVTIGNGASDNTITEPIYTTGQGDREVRGSGYVVKGGEGTTTMPIAAVDPSVETLVTVGEGKLKLTAAEVNYPTTAPAVVTSDAILWLDAKSDNLVTESDGEVTRASMWYDVRDDKTNPTHWYAKPNWVNNRTSSEFWQKKPLVTTYCDCRTLYFGGKSSGCCMDFWKSSADGDAKTKITGIVDYFVVWGVTNSIGLALGIASDDKTCWMQTKVVDYNNPVMWYGRSDCGKRGYDSRNFRDGELFDPFRQGVKRSMQLFSSHAITRPSGNVYVGQAESIYDGYAHSETQFADGGDYVSEIIVFDRSLTEEERMSVERYLMHKWGLPRKLKSDSLPLKRQWNTYAVATNATLEVATGEGETTEPLRLTGAGKFEKSGAGKVVLGPTDGVTFNGLTELKGGAIQLKGGAAPALSVSAGQRLNSRGVNNDPSLIQTNAVGHAAHATEITLNDDAETGTIVKDGPGPARVGKIASDVTKIKVKEGVLVLDGGAKTSKAIATSSGEVFIPNHDFEYSALTRATASPHLNHAWLSGNSGCQWTEWTSSKQSFIFISTQATGASENNWGTWCEQTCPQGTNVLGMTYSGSCYTRITLPGKGRYRLNMLITNRGRIDGKYESVGVYVGNNLVTLKQDKIGAVVAYKEPFKRYYFETPTLEAGEYYLGLALEPSGYKNYAGGNAGGWRDTTVFFDDMHMYLVPEEDRLQTAEKIPNGNFEDIFSIERLQVYNQTNKIVNWSYGTTNLYNNYHIVNAIFPTTIEFGNYLFHMKDGFGSSQVLLGPNASTEIPSIISDAFTPKAGTYKLRGRIGDSDIRWNGTSVNAQTEIVCAYVKIGDGEWTELGSMSSTTTFLEEKIWPTSFTVNGSQSIQIKLEQINQSSAVILDDFDLIAADDLGEDELCLDPKVEYQSLWNVITPAPIKYGKQGGYFQNYGNWVPAEKKPGGYFWGYNSLQGGQYMLIIQNGGMQQTINFPKAGNYQLTYHERSRLTNTYGGNPVKVWLRSAAEDAPAYTNFIARSARYYATNYVENVYNFNVPTAGNYVLAFQGGYKVEEAAHLNDDLEALIDKVSLKYLKDELYEKPDMPENLDIEVAEDAVLNLNFPGTIKVKTLKIGKRRYWGTINNQTCPDMVTGMGSIETGPKDGMLILFR